MKNKSQGWPDQGLPSQPAESLSMDSDGQMRTWMDAWKELAHQISAWLAKDCQSYPIFRCVLASLKEGLSIHPSIPPSLHHAFSFSAGIELFMSWESSWELGYHNHHHDHRHYHQRKTQNAEDASLAYWPCFCISPLICIRKCWNLVELSFLPRFLSLPNFNVFWSKQEEIYRKNLSD